MFGGRDASNLVDVLNDTWEFDGTSWTNVSPANSPPARQMGGMTYDSYRGRIVLFGGVDSGFGPFTRLDDTWEYDGTTWVDVPSQNSPPPQSWVEMTFHGAVGRTLLISKFHYVGGNLSECWEWDGVDWTNTTPAVPHPMRHHFRLSYDSVRRATVLFGGDGRHDTWLYQYRSAWPDEICDNSTDDDSDGLTDCADPDCEGLPCSGGTCSGGVCQ